MSPARAAASLIDHTLLKPEAMRSDIQHLCAEARQHEFASVCVNGCWVSLVASQLAGARVKTCAVVGFPLGANATAAKLAETRIALEDGATEIDMVINIGALRASETRLAEDDIRAVVEASHAKKALVKVILETCSLNDDQKILGCRLSVAAGADFVKTSTGFGKSGATVADVALMRRVVGPDVGVKASGGVRTLEDLRAMVAAGASRIGTSSGVKIVEAAAAAEPR